ncbi:transthyretin domain protein [Phaeosphaeriaceae sp. PMI808]|nr:transthyretin domain protein [Phaeosphaeriaceae sp. PMI808]
MAQDRDFITCEAININNGTPATGLNCTLQLLCPASSQTPAEILHATTDADGHVKEWTPLSGSSKTVTAILAELPKTTRESTWSVKFETGLYFAAQQVESFWPEIEIKFVVNGRGEGTPGWGHYHIPVLVGPCHYSVCKS